MTWKWALALGVLLLIPMAFTIWAQEKKADPREDHLAQVREQYAAETWPSTDRRDGFPLGTIAIDGWKGKTLRHNDGYLTRLFSPPEGAETAFAVTAFVAETPGEAQEVLLKWLSSYQAPAPLPPAEIGDIGFTTPRSAQFARGNIAVRITISRPDTDLDPTDIAGRLDEVILGRETIEKDAPLPRPTITRLQATRTSVPPGDPVPLDVSVTDPTGGPLQLDWIVGGPGQGYVEKRDDRWVLFTTGPGKITLILEAIGSNGTAATAIVEVMVEK